MRNIFLRAAHWIVHNSMGKTWWSFWAINIVCVYFATPWANMFMILGYMAQMMVNQAYSSPLQDWFDSVNEDRKNRIHQEEIALHLMAKGMNPERAKDVSHLTVNVLGLAGYSLPAAA